MLTGIVSFPDDGLGRGVVTMQMGNDQRPKLGGVNVNFEEGLGGRLSTVEQDPALTGLNDGIVVVVDAVIGKCATTTEKLDLHRGSNGL